MIVILLHFTNDFLDNTNNMITSGMLHNLTKLNLPRNQNGCEALLVEITTAGLLSKKDEFSWVGRQF